jgi:hypothetical protein
MAVQASLNDNSDYIISSIESLTDITSYQATMGLSLDL